MTQDIFMVTSACMNDYGIYSRQERFDQLLASLDSITEYAPGADMVVVESSRMPLANEYLSRLCERPLTYYQCAGDNRLLKQDVELDNNQFIAKTFGELVAYQHFFYHLHHCGREYRRCHKLSGRYRLTSQWQNLDAEPEDILVKQPKKWLHSVEQPTQVNLVYDNKHWSWHWNLTSTVSELMAKIFQKTWQDTNQLEQFAIIECSLYQSLNQSSLPIREVERLGVQGNYGQDGRFADE